MHTFVLIATAAAITLAMSAVLVVSPEVATKRQLWAVRLNAAAFVLFALANGWPTIEPFL